MKRNFGLIFGGIAILIALAVWAILSKGIKLGIDLSGGTILVYQIKEAPDAEGDTVDELILALQRRVNPEGVADIPIRPVGNNRLEIILAEATPEEVEILKRKITDVGSLEFLILANHKHDQSAINRIDRAIDRGGFAAAFQAPPSGYRWVRLGDVFEGGATTSGADTGGDAPQVIDADTIRLPGRELLRDRYSRARVTLTGVPRGGNEETTRGDLVILSNTPDTITFSTVDDKGRLTGPKPHGFSTVRSYRIDYNPSEIQVAGVTNPLPEDAVIREWDRGDGHIERYILVEAPRSQYAEVTGEYLSRTFPTQDERFQPAVGFVFNGSGANRFGTLTRTHLPEESGQFKYRLAIVLDGLVRSAPSINSEIRDSGIIEGVQPEEVSYLIEILKAGSLPASIDPTPLLEEKIGPTLGRDTIAKGLRAIVISLAIVPVFMISYYRFAGLVAVLALLLNVLLLVASMAVTGSSFTLPGLAGLALTIGMAVDANVLIFERMREEKERGANITQQIRNGFGKAWSTILDSNLTTILSGAVLWWVGTAEIKGFALTLIIGLIWNLFTAVFVSRAIFDFWNSRGWLHKLSMGKLLDKTQINFVGPRKILMACSAVVILLGLIAFGLRGNDILNIDFTGGTLVTIHLDEDAENLSAMSSAQRSEYVRETARAHESIPDVAVETLNLQGEQPGYRFNIRTTNDDQKAVQAAVVEAFRDSLASVATEVGPSEPITTAVAESTASTAESRFANGHRYPLTFSRPVDPETVRSRFEAILAAAGLENPSTRFAIGAVPGGSQESVTEVFLTTDLDPEVASGYLASLSDALATDPSLLFDRLENFGGAVAGETRTLAVVAIALSWLVIIVYLWFRFKSVSYGLAAVLALVHDVLFTVGAVAISPYKIDLPMIAAFLTLIGFSVNDTIVIFDRIRELKGKSPRLTPELVNTAINQTLSRTIITSLTTWLVVVIFFLFGGEGLVGFSFCLVVGFLSGTYSTIFIAAPILIDWSQRESRSSKRNTSVPAAQKV